MLLAAAAYFRLSSDAINSEFDDRLDTAAHGSTSGASSPMGGAPDSGRRRYEPKNQKLIN